MSKTRTRALGLGLTATATALCGLATIAPTATAVGTDDCKEPFPVADLVANQTVAGLTVVSGTEPTVFDGKVLGVIDDGIGFDTDMIVMRLDSEEIERVGGIWAGMSGSPVYAGDGRLIGAVSYGLAYGSSPVAGVTPFEDMVGHRDAARTAPVSGRLARTIAKATDVTVRQAAQGMAQLQIPMTVSGVPQKALNRTRGRDYLSKSFTAGSSAAASAGPANLEAGGNLGLTWAYGDVTGGGVGTVTSVCADRLVGFGHPSADFLGSGVTYGMHPAEAIYIQEDPLGSPFKVANMAPPAGTITDDNLTGISGPIGTLPTTYDVVSTVTHGTDSRTGTTHVVLPLGMASATFYELFGNHTKVLDGYIPGTSDVTTTVTGRRPDGRPYSVTFGDRYTSAQSVIDVSVWDVPDTVWALGGFAGATVESVTSNADVTDDTLSYTITEAQYRAGGKWVSVGKRGKVQANAGKTLKMRAVLTASDGSVAFRTFSIPVPAKSAGFRGWMQVSGGYDDYYFRTAAAKGAGQTAFDKYLKGLEKQMRNDQFQVRAFFDTNSGTKRFTWVSDPDSRVISGAVYPRIKVS